AALVVCGFLFPVLGALGRAIVDQEAAADAHVSYDVHVRGGGRAVLRFDNGDLFVEPPGRRRVDCHLSVDPAAFLLVAWGRLDQWQAIPRGQLLAWGRKPWVALKLRNYLRNP
ncbi:MAG: SCP2 sterol-binding domain-containing protein, partial [Actinomycetota bacterium]|nr:SCP2 sterol-binding domain-containing protein [Actinomycetota bacterium]